MIDCRQLPEDKGPAAERGGAGQADKINKTMKDKKDETMVRRAVFKLRSEI
jgi:hypothetical protein